jgi:hypothetical protein
MKYSVALLLLAGCAKAEFGFADVEHGHRNAERADPPIETVRRGARVFVTVQTYRVKPDVAAGLDAFADPSVKISNQEALARNGLNVWASRPGVLATIEKRLEASRIAGVTGVVETGGELTLDVGPRIRKSFKLSQYANGDKASAEELDLDGAVLKVEPVAAPGGGAEATITPMLRVVGDPITIWSLPELEAEFVVDAERAVVIVPAGDRPDRFGEAFLGVPGGDRVVLVLSFTTWSVR